VGLFNRRNAARTNLDAIASRLVTTLDGLDAGTRKLTTEKLRLLYSWFAEQYGSVGWFLSRSPDEQQDYLRRLEQAADRAKEKGEGSRPYFLAATLLGTYLRSLSEGRSGPGILALGDRMVHILDSAAE
jgi:hypothetical protein